MPSKPTVPADPGAEFPRVAAPSAHCNSQLSRRHILSGLTQLLYFAATCPAAACASPRATTETATMDHSNERDFDFLHGSWRVLHRRLRRRLADSDEWQEFDGTCTAQPILGGRGNMDDNLLNAPTGAYRAVSFRAYDTTTNRWAIWWLDGRTPLSLDVPVIGAFEHGVGTFYADDTLDGRPVRVRFRWTDTQASSPQWEQAFSPDEGKTWETNWTMRFVRA